MKTACPASPTVRAVVDAGHPKLSEDTLHDVVYNCGRQLYSGLGANGSAAACASHQNNRNELTELKWEFKQTGSDAAGTTGVTFRTKSSHARTASEKSSSTCCRGTGTTKMCPLCEKTSYRQQVPVEGTQQGVPDHGTQQKGDPSDVGPIKHDTEAHVDTEFLKTPDHRRQVQRDRQCGGDRCRQKCLAGDLVRARQRSNLLSWILRTLSRDHCTRGPHQQKTDHRVASDPRIMQMSPDKTTLATVIVTKTETMRRTSFVPSSHTLT